MVCFVPKDSNYTQIIDVEIKRQKTPTHVIDIKKYIDHPPSSTQSFNGGKVRNFSFLNIFFLPFDCIYHIRALPKAIRTGDRNFYRECIVKISSAPIGWVSILERCYSTISKKITFLAIKGLNLTILSTISCIFGSIFLVAELCLETTRLIKTIQFRNSVLQTNFNPKDAANQNTDPEELKLETLFSSINSIHKSYFSLPGKDLVTSNKDALLLDGKLSQLGRRVHIKTANDLKINIPLLLSQHHSYKNEENIESKLATRELLILSATELIGKVDEQSRKTLLVHIIGITGIIMGISIFIGTFVAFPPGLFLFMWAATTVLSLYRGYAPEAFLASDGFSWKWGACIPNFLKKVFISRSAKEEITPKSPELDRNTLKNRPFLHQRVHVFSDPCARHLECGSALWSASA